MAFTVGDSLRTSIVVDAGGNAYVTGSADLFRKGAAFPHFVQALR